MEKDNPVGLQMLREKLIGFSPEYLVNMMTNDGGTLPNVPVHVAYADNDAIVRAAQSKEIIKNLQSHKAQVKEWEISIGGHYWGNSYILHMPKHLRR